jgi:phosphatidylserine decarboxylase
MTTRSDAVDVRRQAGWLPDDQDDLESWLAGHRERVEARGEQVVLHPVLVEFQELIDTDPVVRMYIHQMIAQVPSTKAYSKRHLESAKQLLRLINEVLTMAPEFSESAMVATPLGAILDWTMGTPAGFAAFRDPRINAMLKKILTAWCKFLSKKDSLYVLNDSPSGWKCAAAQKAVGIEQYDHDPQDEHWGFASWNDFFTRRFKDGQRPVASPDDDKVIVSACESTPYGIATDVQRQDRFWIKSQPYSLQDMLANDESVDQFVGGTVYQAFLSATNYHRWHPGGRHDCAGVRPGGHLLLRGRSRRRRRRRADELPVLPGACRRPGDHPHRRQRSRHRPGGLRAGRHVGRVLLHHPLQHQARLPRDEG